MADLIQIILTYWELVVAITSIILSISAFRRYKEKKTGIAYTLAIAFMYFAIGMIFQIFGELLNIFNLQAGELLWSSADANWFLNWMWYLVQSYQFAYFFLILGLFMIYRFSMQLGKTTATMIRNDRIALIFALIIIIFGIFKMQLPLPAGSGEIASILYSVDIYVIIYAIFMIVPVTRQSRFLLHRIEDKSTPDYRHIRIMYFMSFSLILMVLFLILETIWGIATGQYKNPFSFLGFGFAMVSVVLAYYSFYSK